MQVINGVAVSCSPETETLVNKPLFDSLRKACELSQLWLLLSNGSFHGMGHLRGLLTHFCNEENCWAIIFHGYYIPCETRNKVVLYSCWISR